MRYGVTREYKTAKLRRIHAERTSDEHYERTPAVAYGDFDPLVETRGHIARCVCAAAPSLEGVGTGWQIRCACGSSGPVAKSDWRAVLDWNKSPRSEVVNYRALPLFGLRNLEPAAAKERLIGIRRDLELRAKEAGLRRELGRAAGRNYQQRLRAYLAWCIYAQGLVKMSHQLQDGSQA